MTSSIGFYSWLNLNYEIYEFLQGCIHSTKCANGIRRSWYTFMFQCSLQCRHTTVMASRYLPLNVEHCEHNLSFCGPNAYFTIKTQLRLSESNIPTTFLRIVSFFMRQFEWAFWIFISARISQLKAVWWSCKVNATTSSIYWVHDTVLIVARVLWTLYTFENISCKRSWEKSTMAFVQN